MRDLIVFGGQSNMQGQTECLADTQIAEGAWEYRHLTGTMVPLCDPCGEDIRADGSAGYPYSPSASTWHADNVLGSSCDGHTTMLPSFCRTYRRFSQDHPELTAVHAAKGSTTVSQWLPGTDGYRLLTEKASAAAEKSGSLRHRFFVWLQGESDAIYKVSTDDYTAMLTELGHTLRRDLFLTKFGIIRVGRFTMDESDLAIMEAQDRLCEKDPFFVMLTRAASDFCTVPEYRRYMNPQVHGHYSAAGLEKLGELAGKELAKIAGKL